MNTNQREQRVQRALEALSGDSKLSQAKAAKAAEVAATTLSARMNGRASLAYTLHPNAKLNYHQEKVLAKLNNKTRSALLAKIFVFIVSFTAVMLMLGSK